MIDNKQIFTLLGIDESTVKTFDDFKKAFEPKFVHVDSIAERDDLLDPIMSTKVGGLRGSIEVALKRLGRAEGIDFSKEELKDKKTEDIASLLVGKIKSKYEGSIEELNSKIGKNSDEVVKGWEVKYQNLEKKLGDTATLLQDTTTKFEALENDSKGKIKEFQIGYAKKDALSKLPLRSDLKPIEKEGFNAIIQSKYQLDFDEKDGLVVRDKAGKRVANEKQTGTYKSFDQVLAEEAEANGLTIKNPHAQRNNTMNTNQNQVNLGQTVNLSTATNGVPVQGRRVSARVKA